MSNYSTDKQEQQSYNHSFLSQKTKYSHFASLRKRAIFSISTMAGKGMII
jgi:hypothetical protein